MTEPFKVVIPTVKKYAEIAEGEIVIHPQAPGDILIKPAKYLSDLLWKADSMKTDMDSFISVRGHVLKHPLGQSYIVVGTV